MRVCNLHFCSKKEFSHLFHEFNLEFRLSQSSWVRPRVVTFAVLKIPEFSVHTRTIRSKDIFMKKKKKILYVKVAAFSDKRESATGASHSMLSNRLSWFYDLKGSSVTLDTACSSSLVGLHLGCQSLLHGESDMASPLLIASELFELGFETNSFRVLSVVFNSNLSLDE